MSCLRHGRTLTRSDSGSAYIAAGIARCLGSQEAEPTARGTCHVVDEVARERAIYQALKVAAKSLRLFTPPDRRAQG